MLGRNELTLVRVKAETNDPRRRTYKPQMSTTIQEVAVSETGTNQRCVKQTDVVRVDDEWRNKNRKTI